MRSGWTRWNRLTGTSRYPDESPRVILAVEPDRDIPGFIHGRGQGPGGPVYWRVYALVKDRTVALGARLETVAGGQAPDCSAGRAAVEQAYRAMDAATRGGSSVVDSHMTENGQGQSAPTSDRANGQEVQRS